jgi:hypothetical protein
MDLLLQEVQTAAEAVNSGDPLGRGRLLEATNKLTLAVETPTETLMRMLYQVSSMSSIFLSVNGLQKSCNG